MNMNDGHFNSAEICGVPRMQITGKYNMKNTPELEMLHHIS